MKHIFQLVNHEDGQRSEPFVLTRKALADVLMDYADMDDYVLVIADIVVDGADPDFSTAPMMKCSRFVSLFSTEFQPDLNFTQGDNHV